MAKLEGGAVSDTLEQNLQWLSQLQAKACNNQLGIYDTSDRVNTTS